MEMRSNVPQFLASALLLISTVACADQPKVSGEATSNPSASAYSAADSTCIPADQDRYVWRASRLQLVEPCMRASGMVVDMGVGADGDLHINLSLDPPDQKLLNAGNRQNEGYLIVEAVCQFPPPMMEALRVCASDPDPYHDPLPHPGDHVWMEGRYVLDLQHYAWAELHPLYRWGVINP